MVTTTGRYVVQKADLSTLFFYYMLQGNYNFFNTNDVAYDDVSESELARMSEMSESLNFLGLFDSVRWTPGGPNYTRHADQRVDSLLHAASLLPTGEERLSMLREAERLVLEAMPVIPLWHDDVLHLVSTAWSGWRVTPNNRLDLRHVQRRREARP